MTTTLGTQQRVEPDVLVVQAAADGRMEQSDYAAEDVVLAIEVVSPDSAARDRARKPQLYAQAGIPHFWRAENDGGNAVIYVYELDPPPARTDSPAFTEIG